MKKPYVATARSSVKRFGRCPSLSVLLLLLSAFHVWAGPPFFTDDPDPVDFRHWEIYLASQWVRERSTGTTATLPHIEVNYGAVPDMQLHVLVPVSYSAPEEGSGRYGLGDVEFGIMYRFVREDKKGWIPEVGTFPIMDLPTGDSSRGLGKGRVRIFLPLWVLKSLGPWTTYGGGGFNYHPGPGNLNYWYAGWVLQRDLSDFITVGAEVFNLSPRSGGEGDETGFNAGGIINFSGLHHLLFSIGRDIKGPNTFFSYLAFKWAFGP